MCLRRVAGEGAAWHAELRAPGSRIGQDLLDCGSAWLGDEPHVRGEVSRANEDTVNPRHGGDFLKVADGFLGLKL